MAKEKLRVEVIQGHDKACKDDPKNKTGKPVINPHPKEILLYQKDEHIYVEKLPIVYSCKDKEDTNTVKSANGPEYYRIARGKGKDLQFGIYPAGGWINANKVREV